MPKTKRLMNAVDKFSKMMKRRLCDKAESGFTGWNNKDDISNILLINSIRDRVEKVRFSYLKREPFLQKDLVDIANFSMMLSHRKI